LANVESNLYRLGLRRKTLGGQFNATKAKATKVVAVGQEGKTALLEVSYLNVLISYVNELFLFNSALMVALTCFASAQGNKCAFALGSRR
jgi:hypothetical protein